MQSDIEICRNTPLSSIDVIAEKVGLSPEEYDTHGKHKAKVHPKCLERLKANDD
ncbi:formate--tetrahydrofolate ligase, partial [Vibrio parahaemolyticus]|nr:formate--tetrahydrofolate ligase [Vibrio parahaemolyticus]